MKQNSTSDQNSLVTAAKGQPLYSVGVNYWPRKTGPLMWSRWDESAIERELQQIADLHLNTVRYFLYWPDFMPSPDYLEPTMLSRLSTFDALCTKYHLSTFPSFFVGHMSGEDWDIPWRGERKFYSDPWMLEQESFYVSTVVQHLLESTSVAGWLLSNEIPNYGGTGPADTITSWVRHMTNTIKLVDPERPVSVGDGAWNSEIYGVNQTEFRFRELEPIIDFAGPHFYHENDDSFRHSVLPQFVTRCSQQFFETTLIEEFGCSNSMTSLENQAAYYRNVLYTTLMSGAKGAWAWCYSDFDLPYQRPYSHHGHEFYFGITTNEGTVKPSGKELSQFSKIVNELNLAKYHPVESGARMLLPSHYYIKYPYTWDDKEQSFRMYLQAFTMLVKSGVNPAILYEPESDFSQLEDESTISIPDDINLLYAPGLRALTSQFELGLLEWIDRGGVLFASYGAEPWLHYFEDLFGVKHQLRFGISNHLSDDEITFTFQQPLGAIAAGEKISFNNAGPYLDTGYCPIDPNDATVLATDQAGNPALVMSGRGKGKVYFCTYPIELIAGLQSEINQTDACYRIHQAVGETHLQSKLVQADSPFIQSAQFQVSDTQDVVVCFNHHWDEVETSFQFPADAQYSTVEAIRSGHQRDVQDGSLLWTFESKGAEVFVLRRA